MGDLWQYVMTWILWLYTHFCPDPNSPANLDHLWAVLRLEDFAGAYWQDATSGMAAWWAVIIDNLLDLVDPYPSIRGDH